MAAIAAATTRIAGVTCGASSVAVNCDCGTCSPMNSQESNSGSWTKRCTATMTWSPGSTSSMKRRILGAGPVVARRSRVIGTPRGSARSEPISPRVPVPCVAAVIDARRACSARCVTDSSDRRHPWGRSATPTCSGSKRGMTMTTTTVSTCDATGLASSPRQIPSVTPSRISTCRGVDRDLPRLKSEAHRHIDAFWRRAPHGYRTAARMGVYAWLRRMTGMSKEDCHVSRFDRGLCEAVIDLCKQVQIGLIEGPRITNGSQRTAAWVVDKHRHGTR